MKVLAIKTRRLGDSILWTGALKALQEHFPTGEIHILFPEAYAALFESDPRFSQKIPIGRQLTKKLIRTIRKNRYDWVLNFHASRRSKLLVQLCRSSRRLIHHHSRTARNFGSDERIVGLGEPASAIERDLNVIRTLGWKGSPPATRIYVAQKITSRGEKILSQAGWRGSQKILILNPIASRRAKEWPLERYGKVAQETPSGYQVFVMCQSKLELFERGWHSLPLLKKLPVVETPTLSDAIGVVSHASKYVGSDSGIKHLACALSVPTVTLFGPESVGEWHGYERIQHPFLQIQVGCRNNDPSPPEFAWCGADICPLSSHACMNLLSAEEVIRLL